MKKLQTSNLMESHKNNAKTIGTLFVIATVAAIAGLLLYTPILQNPNYIIDGTSNHQIAWGAVFEIITAFAVIGTSVTLYPTLKEYDGRMALAAVAFRIAEATVIIIGIVCLLAIVTLNFEFRVDGSADHQAYAAIGKLLVAFHNWTFLFGPNVLLGPSTLMTAYILYKMELVPKSVSILGLIGGPAIFACGVLVTLGAFEQLSVWGTILTLPVFFYEMYLAVYLIIRGFKTAEAKMESIHNAPLHNLYKLAEEKMIGKN
jgi:hypothetical protein